MASTSKKAASKAAHSDVMQENLSNPKSFVCSVWQDSDRA